ncbi:MAG: ribonuclease III, partial [Lachnospiraceae bacterium]|nr:ribonuclease III [Lachnospiraceae bacterium]
MDRFKEFQEKIGYTWQDPDLLQEAFTHSSYANEQKGRKDYERLEFLGDAVLELTASEYLYRKFPDLKEGELTKKRASMVCETALAWCASDLGISSCLNLGKGEEAAGGRERETIIADVMEAIAGAIYLDGGFEKAKKFVTRYILENQENIRLFYDSKTILQEVVQGRKLGTLRYEIVD